MGRAYRFLRLRTRKTGRKFVDRRLRAGPKTALRAAFSEMEALGHPFAGLIVKEKGDAGEHKHESQYEGQILFHVRSSLSFLHSTGRLRAVFFVYSGIIQKLAACVKRIATQIQLKYTLPPVFSRRCDGFELRTFQTFMFLFYLFYLGVVFEHEIVYNHVGR